MSAAELCHAGYEDLPQLFRLCRVFAPGEKQGFYHRFLTQLFSPETCFLAKDRGEILSFCHALSYQAFLEGESHRVAYLYSPFTRPELRRQGIFTALHRYVKEELTRSGFQLLFVFPEAGASLEFWLYKLGYRNLFYRSGFYVPTLPDGFAVIPPQSRLLYEIYRRAKEAQSSFHILEDSVSFSLTMEGKEAAVDLQKGQARGYVIFTRKKDGFIIHDYPALGPKRLSGAGRRLPGAPALPLGTGELFDRLYKTKPKLNFLLN